MGHAVIGNAEFFRKLPQDVMIADYCQDPGVQLIHIMPDKQFGQAVVLHGCHDDNVFLSCPVRRMFTPSGRTE